MLPQSFGFPDQMFLEKRISEKLSKHFIIKLSLKNGVAFHFYSFKFSLRMDKKCFVVSLVEIGSEEYVENIKSLWTDGQTVDRQNVIKRANLSFQLG